MSPEVVEVQFNGVVPEARITEPVEFVIVIKSVGIELEKV
jgi:hypothetical protein